MKHCFIDVHAHIEMIEMSIEKIVGRANDAGVGIIVAQGVKPESNRKVLEFAEKHKEIKAALGLYPIDALKMSDNDIENELDFIRQNKKKISAIGEVGLDYKEDEKEQDRQTKIFRKIVSLALELDKPLIIHSRKAEKEILEILEEMKARKVIMHCFSGKFSLVERIVKKGWSLTIPTSVKNSEHFQKIAGMVPIEQLFCETDSPYLHPNKEWPNEPANVVVSYEKIAEIKKMKLEDVRDKIFENYVRMFG